MTSKLELRLLGGCQIAYEGTVLQALTLNKARALLAYLAVTNRTQHRAHLVDLLWTEMPAADARRNLRVVLTKLRQLTGDHVVATRTEIGLRAGLPRQVDVLDFMAAAALLRSERAWPVTSVTTVAAAFAAYEGDFLDGLEIPNAPGFEEWMLLERERLRQLAFQYGERLADHYDGSDNDHAAVAVWQRLLEIEPWHERIHRRLMTVLARAGQPMAALLQYEQCRRLLANDLAIEPEAATTALYHLIREESAATTPALSTTATITTAPLLPPSTLLHTNIPVATTPFHGRATELRQLITHLSNSTCRLMSLVGPGGVGKTRLAQQVALRFVEESKLQNAVARERFSSGIFFVGATALPTIDELLHAVAGTLGITFRGQEPVEAQLLNQLATEHLLLVLDNFEHLVPEGERLVTWLARVPGLTLLITTRERLHLSAEWLFSVEGLPLPSTAEQPEELANNDAIQLFVRRAQRVNLGFTFPHGSTAERTALIAICRLLEGMPLALELAAAWARTHNCVEILLEIRANFDFLTADLRDMPARHRSLRATFDHSWQRLAQEDAQVLQRLVLLPAGLHATFAHRIAQASSTTLMRLVDKSLVQRSPGGRYTMHELLRQYVAQQLTVEEHDAIFRRYVRAYTPWLHELHNACESVDEQQALENLAAEFENLRAIWYWMLTVVTAPPTTNASAKTQHAVAVDEAVMVALHACLPMITFFYLRRSRYREGVDFLQSAATKLMNDPLTTQRETKRRQQDRQVGSPIVAFVACLTVALADLRFHLSEFGTVVEMIEASLPTLQQHGRRLELAYGCTTLGKAQIRMGRYAEAEHTLQKALATYQAMGQRKASAAVFNALGILHSNQGHFAKAATYYETYLAIAREHQYQRGIANALNNLGSNYARNEDYQRSLPFYRETYDLAQVLGEELMLAVALSNLGSSSRALGDFDAAHRYYTESLSHCRAMGERRWTAAGLNGLGLTYFDQGDHDAAKTHFAEALAIAGEIDSVPDLLDALTGLALVQSEASPIAETIALLTFLAESSVTQTLSRQRAVATLETLREQLPQAVYDEGVHHGARLTPETASSVLQ